ncbi:MAG TPA: roadblock/LC7 domain-containing protein [bacterium]|nr:roadblock/LC7 domain-containing protein [bacterium]
MRLKEILTDLVERTPGARAAVLADWEGEAVVAYTSGDQTDYDIKFVGAHQGIILTQAREMIERCEMGAARELSFAQQNFQVITIPVNSDYYLVLTLQPGPHAAFARATLKKAVREIEEDIA